MVVSNANSTSQGTSTATPAQSSKADDGATAKTFSAMVTRAKQGTTTLGGTSPAKGASSGSSPVAKPSGLTQSGDSGDPEDAQNGTEAAKDLLSTTNSFFYNPVLRKVEADYSPDKAKAESFTATLDAYEQRGDNADIAQLINTLGPKEAAQLLANAGQLTGPQYNEKGTAFAQNQAGVDKILGNALTSTGVLDGPTGPGTLNAALLQEASASQSGAQSVAAILGDVGGGKEGVFGSKVPAADRQQQYLNAETIKRDASQGLSIDNDTLEDVENYLNGQGGSKNESQAQRLGNLMSMLGPQGTYAALSQLGMAKPQGINIGSDLQKLASSGKFTGADARAIAEQQGYQTKEPDYSFGGQTWASWLSTLPNTSQGNAVKNGWAQGSVTAAQHQAQAVASGKYSGVDLENANANLNEIAQSATQVSSNLPDQDKVQLFDQFYAAGKSLSGPQAGQERNFLNTYAANILGSLHSKSEIATTLRGLGGVGSDGTLSGNAANFINSALAGQAELNPETDGSPKGVTVLLDGIAKSGDRQLMAGTLNDVAQWAQTNPKSASVLAAQDQGSSATGFRNALTTLFSNSFPQFVQLGHDGPVGELNATQLEDLQVLTTIETGQPYTGDASKNFASAYGKAVGELIGYAGGHLTKNTQGLDSAFGGSKTSAAKVFGQLIGSFNTAVKNSKDSLLFDQTTGKNPSGSNDSGKLQTSFALLNGIGAGLLAAGAIAAAAGTGGTALPLVGSLFVFGGTGGSTLQGILGGGGNANISLTNQIESGGLVGADALNKVWDAWDDAHDVTKGDPLRGPAESGYNHGVAQFPVNVGFYDGYDASAGS